MWKNNIKKEYYSFHTYLVAQMVRSLLAMQETRV